MKVKFLSGALIGALLLMGACLGDSEEYSLAEQKSDIDAYLLSKGITAYDEINGLRFTVDSLASGHTPRYDSKVTFDYTGKFLDGTVFETSTLKNIAIDKSNLIAGFKIGLLLIPNGSKATLYIPSDYAYGSQAVSNIPANSNLIFQIKLKSIQVTAVEKNQLGADTVKIDEYLTTAGVANVQKDSSGLRYTIDLLGTGPKPTWYDKVKISYTGYLITNGAKGDKFFTGTNEPNSNNDSRVANYIRGFQVGLQLLPEGSKATFYLPSGLAFGTQAVPGSLANIPANSNLIYEVELTEVLNP